MAQGGVALQVEHGDSLELEMTIQMNARIDRAVVQVLFWNMEMLAVLNVLGPNLQGFPVVNTPDGRNVINMKIENLLLNSGTHAISVLVTSPGFSNHYLRHDNAAEVRMMTRTPSGAQSVTEGEWKQKGQS